MEPLKFFNFPYLYLFLWMFLSFLPFVYYSTKAYLALLIFFAVSALYYTFYALTNCRLIPYFKSAILLVSFLTIYGLYLIVLGDEVFWESCGIIVERYRYLLWLYISMLSVVPVYVFTCNGFLKEKEMKVLFFIMTAAGIFAYHKMNQQYLLLALTEGTEQEEFTITSIYILLSALPILVVFKKSLFQFLVLCIYFVYLILSAKRGAIALGTICILFFVWYTFAIGSLKKKLFVLFMTVLLCVGLLRFVTYQLEKSPYLALRYEQTLDGYSSRRDEYNEKLLNYALNENPTKNFVFGIGAQGTLAVNDNFAHNDWIAILLEQGVIGLFLYVIYWICFIFAWIKSFHNKDAFVGIGLLIIIGFGKSLFSMYYLPATEIMIISSGFFAIGLGYFLGKAYPQNEQFLLIVKRDKNEAN